MDDTITRRNLLVAASAAVAVATSASQIAAAADEQAAPPGAEHAPAEHAKLIDAARACVADGERCLAHCLAMFKSGDTSLAVCAQRVSEMLPACDAVARLATLGAPRLGEFAAACRDVCDDCEKECRKHADTHAICKACADSCARFIAEAKHLTLA
jgi:Cys-rich four helix bundle protein (predicted Tat secretion target)